MKKKYNLALLPKLNSQSVVDLANHLKWMAHTYCLGQSSIPHVTLHQFFADEVDLPKLWEKMTSTIQFDLIKLTFSTFSCLSFDSKIVWISLIPDEPDVLHYLHHKTDIGLNALTARRYDPHMTLINTVNSEYVNHVALIQQNYQPIRDVFILTMGECDEVGQVTNILYRLG